jgi:hypothetical protein
MPELKGDITRLPKHQLDKACEMLSRAFFYDPKMLHLIPDFAAKKELSRYLFEFEIQYGINYGDVYTLLLL